MIALFIGGTGTISMAITRLAVAQGWKLYLLNRGNRHAKDIPEGVELINADIYNESDVAEKIKGMEFDVVCDFIVFHPSALERDYRLFKGRTIANVLTHPEFQKDDPEFDDWCDKVIETLEAAKKNFK